LNENFWLFLTSDHVRQLQYTVQGNKFGSKPS